jgi:rod shape-determining protein MreD
VRRLAVFLGLGALALFLQATLLGALPFGVLRPDLVLLLLLYLAGRSDAASGGVVAFCLGYGMDILSGAPFGTFTVTKVLVFFGAYLAAQRIYLTEGLVPAVAAAAFTVLEAVAIRLLFGAIGLGGGGLNRALLLYVAPQALLMGVLAPFVFYCLGRVDKWLEDHLPGADDRPAPLM